MEWCDGKIADMEVDPDKIQKKLEELNASSNETNPWAPVNGYNVMPEIRLEKDALNVSGNSGMVIKVFVNQETGEIKSFPIALFAPDKKQS